MTARSHCRCRAGALACLGLFTLGACGGNFQAPVSEQGEVQQRRAPIIVDSRSSENSYALPRDSIGISTGNSARGNGAVISAGSHRVRAGDTLYSIAYLYELDFRRLAAANGLNPPYTIFVGQDINLDLDRVVSAGSGNTLGTPVENNSVARARGSIARAGGLLRQAIGMDSLGEPDWQWPLHGDLLRDYQEEINKGIDIGGRVGDPVLAAAAGDVVYAGQGVQGSGKLIIIRHGDRYLSAYGHNRTMLVTEGARVESGQQIAELGASAAGIAMLHFEIRVDGEAVDPGQHLPPR